MFFLVFLLVIMLLFIYNLFWSVIFSKVCEDNTELQSILGFHAQKLPITYLGLSIMGKKKTHNQCWNLKAYPTHWEIANKMEWRMFIIWGKNPIR